MHGLECPVTPKVTESRLSSRKNADAPTSSCSTSSPSPSSRSPALLFAGCNKSGGSADNSRVVLYTSVDQPVAEPIVREFEKRTGIKVDLQTDTEATKSSGLAARLQAERANPQADVWWGNEVFHTINLAENGVLAPYESPSAADIPAKFKDPGHRWAGSGAAGPGDRLPHRRRRREARGQRRRVHDSPRRRRRR